LNTRVGFVLLLVALIWAKTLLANIVDFNLFSGASIMQWITMLINPLTVSSLLIGLAFYFKSARVFYPIAIVMYIINLVLLQLNVTYYREFTDFMSVATMLGYDKVNQGLGASGFALTNLHDILFWIDLPIFIGLFLFKKLKFQTNGETKFLSFAMTTFSIFAFMLTLLLGEIDRPQLITRQFDSSMMVKYLGMDAYTVIDGLKQHNVAELRKSAKKTDIQKAMQYINQHYTDANAKYVGLAKGKNVFMIHLESFQQFSIDMQINNQAVTPNLNSIYHSDSTIAFDNFFNQVGQGKTSDAENMLETSTFGLPQGSLFATQGNNQTFQAMPAILNQTSQYASAVFHGNNASFWNRNNVYKNMGYQYFFDASYYDTSGDKAMGYGLKDKLLFNDSIPYLEHLQQPFYAKYITVSNHFPYSLDEQDKDPNFMTSNTGSDIVDGYFETNHYLDQSIGEFINYLKKAGLYDKSIIVMYGDHYGISNSENKYLAPLLGKTADKWTKNDDAQLQRVPFMINIPGWHGGGINHTYGGEIDVMPTLLHLLGVDSKRYAMVGQDLLSGKSDQIVVFRNKDFITPTYSDIGGTIYDNKTGELVEKPSVALQHQVEADKKKAHTQLRVSDDITQKDLLRFNHPKGFKAVEASKYNYSNGLAKLEKLESLKKGNSTSLWSTNGHTKTQSIYETDAPEKNEPRSDTSRIKQVNPDGGDDTDGGNNTPNP